MLVKRRRQQPRPGIGCVDCTKEGWLALGEADAAGSQCPVEKLKPAPQVRRTTGGMATCVLPCGLLADWIELWRGESLQLVYVARVLMEILRILGTSAQY